MFNPPVLLTNLPVVAQAEDIEVAKKVCSHSHLHNIFADADSDVDVEVQE
jgi:hypothetical protein